MKAERKILPCAPASSVRKSWFNCRLFVAALFVWFLLPLTVQGANDDSQDVASPGGAAATGTPPTNPKIEKAPDLDDSSPDNGLTGDWGGIRSDLAKYGIAFEPTWIEEVLANPVGGRRQGIVSDGNIELPLDIDLEKATKGAVQALTFHVNAFYIYGGDLSDSHVGDISTTSNIAAYNTLRLDELWVEKGFGDDLLSIRVGNMAVEDEFFQAESADIFIDGTFGELTLVANNIPDVPIYPVSSPGVRFLLHPDAAGYVLAGVYGLDNGSDEATTNQNGTRFSLNAHSGFLVVSEAGYLLNRGARNDALQGKYAIGSFVDTGNFTTLKSQADVVNGTGSLQSGGTDFGVYAVVDQQIYRRDQQAISFFSHIGGAPTNTNFVDFYVDGGFDCKAPISGRPDDEAGLAMARTHVSRDFSFLEEAQGDRPSSAETVIEATYKAQISSAWVIQPDIQYIVTPSGKLGSPDALILGVRSSVSF